MAADHIPKQPACTVLGLHGTMLALCPCAQIDAPSALLLPCMCAQGVAERIALEERLNRREGEKLVVRVRAPTKPVA
jgi:endonuclease/exonuclease/phosphatase family metal-dependent hydrolase